MGANTSTGLGLSFCKMAVEIHGGEIGVHSDENGTEFWFTLPDQHMALAFQSTNHNKKLINKNLI